MFEAYRGSEPRVRAKNHLSKEIDQVYVFHLRDIVDFINYKFSDMF